MQLIVARTGGKLQAVPTLDQWREIFPENNWEIRFQTDRMEGPKKQASLFSFFQKTPKSKAGPNGDTSKAESNKKAPTKTGTESAWEVDIMHNLLIIRLVDNDPIARPDYLFGQD